MKILTIRAPGLALAFAWTPAATARDITLQPVIDVRLRYEQVEQEGIADRSDALTLRVRSGIQGSSGPWSALVESEATLAIGPHYNDGLNGRALPLVADPQTIELNRAQLRYAAHGTSVTVGRQRVELADQRFVGPALWRQNEQTYDAVRVQWDGRDAGVPGLSIDATYSWNLRTGNGIDGRGARPSSIPGRSWFGLASYATPVGTLTGFAYLIDRDLAAVQGFRESTQTYGARVAGSRPIGGAWKIGYAASAARQGDYRRNPNRFRAGYYLAEATLSGKVIAATGGYEVLGADRGVPLTAFQTPLGALFKFQGWAGKFTTTPPDGVRDLYSTVAANWKAGGPITGWGLAVTYHRFASDRAPRRYGDEIDLLAQAKLHRTIVAARVARYRADRFATDTTKFFVSAEWALP